MPVYLDNHATTRTDPRVVEAMLPYFHGDYGNAASAGHRLGWDAADALEHAREQVALLLGANAREVVFTSGATEANNLAIKGVLPGLERRGNHVVTSAVEHKSVLEPMKRMSRMGWELTVVPPDSTGLVAAEAIEAALTDRTVLVSVMAANNEVGTLNPIEAIGRHCRARGIVFHTDATQAVGKVRLDVRESSVDLLSLSAHKLHGPKGIGALFVRRGDPSLRLTPLLDGGGQERGLRSGTVAVPLVVGLGEAAGIALREGSSEADRFLRLRERLWKGLADRLAGIRVNGHPTQRLPGNLNVSFDGVDGERLMLAIRDVAVSSGAACGSGGLGTSHVLVAMGLGEELARASLRFGIGRFTTEEEVEFASRSVAETVERLRLSPGSNFSEEGERVRLGIDRSL
ncbi:MAG: IscS subfamily cysteine desulfurase [Isosphaeraceae bacterium]